MGDAGTTANLVTLVANVGLALAKIGVGTVAGSAALVADGMNSAGDVLATTVALVGRRIGLAPPDDDHPFGHDNAESVAGVLIGGALLATGVFVAIDGVRALASGPRTAPEWVAVPVALGTAVIKAALAGYAKAVGQRVGSPALLASAADHRADVLIALSVAAGVAVSRLGVPWVDPVVAVLVGLWITGLAIEPLRSNLAVLMDRSPPERAAAVREAAAAVPGVVRVDVARVHPVGAWGIADLELTVDGDLSLRAAHDIAHAVEERVRARVERIREVRVHVNPDGGSGRT